MISLEAGDSLERCAREALPKSKEKRHGSLLHGSMVVVDEAVCSSPSVAVCNEVELLSHMHGWRNICHTCTAVNMQDQTKRKLDESRNNTNINPITAT